MTGSSTLSSDDAATVADRALLHDVDALACSKRQRHVLLHQQDRHAFVVQDVDDLRICETMRGISPSVGSSSRMILGSSIIARAIASICCSPPDSVPPAWLRRSPSTGKISKDLVEQLLLARLGDAVAIEDRCADFPSW